MEPFQVSLNQVNFEEQELGGEALDAFSNIFSHDAPDFEDPDSEGVPVTARRYNPQPHNFASASSRVDGPGNGQFQQHFLQEAATQHSLPGYFKDTPVSSSSSSVTQDTPSQLPPKQAQPLSTTVSGATTPQAAALVEAGSGEGSPSFDAFTHTVEALALQKSVIGGGNVVPASSEEIARAIEEARSRMKTHHLTDSSSSSSDAHSLNHAASAAAAASSNAQTTDEESIQITMTTQGSYDIVLKDRHGNSISSPSVAGGNIVVTPPPPSQPQSKVTSTNAQNEDVQAALNEYAERKLSLQQQTSNGGEYQSQGSEEYEKIVRETVQVIQNKDRIRTTDLGMDLSGKHLVKAQGPKDPDYVNVKYVRTDGDHILDPDYVNVRYLRKNGDQILQFEENGTEICNNAAHTPDKELIRIQAHEMTIEKSPSGEMKSSSWFGGSGNTDTERGREERNAQFGTSANTTAAATTTTQSSSVTNTEWSASKPQQQQGQTVSAQIDTTTTMQQSNPKSRSSSESSLPGNPRKPRPSSFPSSRSSLNSRKSLEAPLASMVEFDLGEGNQLYFDPERPEEAAKEAEPKPKYVQDSNGKAQKLQQISQGPRINLVLPERRVSGIKLDMPPEQLAMELEQTIREKTKLEGQLEVLDVETRQAIRERAELSTQVAAMSEQLRAASSSTQALVADRNAMAADLETLRQNRERLEQVIVSAQKLLEERAGEVGVLREDVVHGKRAQEGLQNTLADCKRDLAARDHTVSDLKAKIAELYVQFQTTNQSRLLLENEVRSLQTEITSLTTAKEWYQQQLQLSQTAKKQLQKEVTTLKGEVLSAGALVERLRTDGVRSKQQLAATQRTMLQEKELLARHLEAIEADMLERDAAFTQLQREKEAIQKAIDTKSSVVVEKSQQLAALDTDSADLTAELNKAQNELRRKTTALDMVQHEKAELSGRLAVAESNVTDLEKELDSLRHNHTERQVQLGQVRADLAGREEDISKLSQEKSMILVELNTVKEEKKLFDGTLQSLKQDMGKVERSFRHIKNELAEKSKELEKLRGRSTESLSDSEISSNSPDTDDAKILKEDYAKLKRQFQTYRDKALHEIADMKAKNQNLNLEISKLKSTIILSESRLSTPEREIGEADETETGAAKSTKVCSEEVRKLEEQAKMVNEEKEELERRLAGEHAVAEREGELLTKAKHENEELRLKVAEIQRESHKEIARQKAKALKLGKDLEMTLKDKRALQQSLTATVEEQQARMELLDQQKQQLHDELQKMHTCLSKDLDSKTQQMQQQLEAVTLTLTRTQEEKVSLESQLREGQRDSESVRLDCETYQMKLQGLEEQVKQLTARADKQREHELEEEKRLVELELEKEKGRLAGLAQSCEQLKRHAASLELALARREGSAVEQTAHAQGEVAQKERELADLRANMAALRDSLDREQNAVRESKKQLMKEKGNHVKTRRQLETLWVEHDQLKVDLRQKLKELELSMAAQAKHRESELKYKMEADAAMTEAKGLKLEAERLRRETQEHQAKDPVLYEQIKSLEWQVSEKQNEVSALSTQLQLSSDRQQMEVNTMHMAIQSSQAETSKLRQELVVVRRDKAALSGRAADLKAALVACVEHVKSIQDSRSGGDHESSQLDIQTMEKLLHENKTTAAKSKPLSFLQATLSELRGEISCLQDQMDEHASAVQTSSAAWRELEQQVEDLRAVCKSSAAIRTSASPAVSTVSTSSTASPIPPIPAAAAAIVGAPPSPATAASFIKTSSMTPNSIYSPKKTVGQE